MRRDPIPRLIDLPAEQGSTEASAKSLFERQAKPIPLSSARLRALRVRIETVPAATDWQLVRWSTAAASLVLFASIGFAQPGSFGARIRELSLRAITSVMGTRKYGLLEKATRPVAPNVSAAPARPQPRPTLLKESQPSNGMAASASFRTVAPAPVPTLAPQFPAATHSLASRTSPSLSWQQDVRASTSSIMPARAASTRAVASSVPVLPEAPSPQLPSRPSPAPFSVSSPLAIEAASLSEIAELAHSPASAQTALDKLRDHRSRFAHGVLAEEADLTELDADVTLGRRTAALLLLPSLERHAGPRQDELRVLHGELLSQVGDHVAALREFSPEPSTPELAERALYDRASCLSTLGRSSEARDALKDYLRQFPAGHFANAARQALTDANIP